MLFVDTGYLLALEIANDQNHVVAIEHWQKLLAQSPQLLTTSYVFDEVVTFFKSRGLHDKAVEVGHSLISSPSIQLVHVEPGLFFEGWHYLQQHQDKTYSLTDCLSFVVMKQFGIGEALTFDQHFVQAGFVRTP